MDVSVQQHLEVPSLDTDIQSFLQCKLLTNTAYATSVGDGVEKEKVVMACDYIEKYFMICSPNSMNEFKVFFNAHTTQRPM